jgi:hypothetical protein
MPARKTRLALTVLAVALPGPWTPVIVLAYFLARANEAQRSTTDHATAQAVGFATPAPDPFAPGGGSR